MEDRPTVTAKKRVAAAAALVLVLIVVYTVAIPTVVANHYLGTLNARTADVKSKLKQVAVEAETGIFADPDISLAERQIKITSAMRHIHEARATLDELDRANKLSRLPGNGFAGDYHTAVVRQERAGNIVRQSKQVLEAYASAISFLNRYTELQRQLDAHLASVNDVRDLSTLAGKGRNMAHTASLIRADQKTLQSLVVPSDFTALQGSAVATFGQAATGFDRLARGLNRAADPQIDGAVKDIEIATNKNQVIDKDLLVSLAVNSSVLRQLAELPEKVEHAQER